MENYRLVLILVLLSLQLNAQTTFYFEESGTPYGAAPTTTGWTNTASAITRPLLQEGFKQSTTIATTTISVDNSSSTATTLFYRGVSPALEAQTISGTVSGFFRLRISNATGATTQSRVKITVVDRTGAIVATLLNITSGASNLTTTLTSYQVLNAAALTSYTCARGDRLVVEVGIGRSAGTTARNGDISFGSSSATNITAAGQTAANNPVVTFSGNIQFYKGVTVN